MKLIKNIDEALKLQTIEEVEHEIAGRRELRNLMVGNLYPHIVTNEIIQLQYHLEELQRNGIRRNN